MISHLFLPQFILKQFTLNRFVPFNTLGGIVPSLAPLKFVTATAIVGFIYELFERTFWSALLPGRNWKRFRFLFIYLFIYFSIPLFFVFIFLYLVYFYISFNT
jgi:hypothetical protein